MGRGFRDRYGVATIESGQVARGGMTVMEFSVVTDL